MSRSLRSLMLDFRNMRGPCDLAPYIGCPQHVVDQVLSLDSHRSFQFHQIPKKGRKGGHRQVVEVRDRAAADAFKGLSRRLDEYLRSVLPGFPHPAAHGYLRDRCTRTNAGVHLGCSVVLKVDIRDFFPSITQDRIQRFLSSVGFQQEAARSLARFLTINERLALGLPTSPLIANALCHELDRRLASLTEGIDCRYSRYADDLSFSGVTLPSHETVARELESQGFEMAEEKLRVVRRGRGLFVTGLSIEKGDRPRVPKQFKRSLRRELHYASTYGLVEHIGRRGYPSIHSGVNKIHGRIQYLRGIERELGDALHNQWLSLLRKSQLSVSYTATCGAPSRSILFCVDESEILLGDNRALALALVVIEDRDVVSQALREFRESVRARPFVTTAPDVPLFGGIGAV